MSIITSIVSVLSFITITALALGFLWFAFDWTRERAWKRREITRTRDRADAARREGRRMVSLAHWWSEDPKVMRAVKCIGEQMQDAGRFDVAEARRRWQETRKDDT